MNGHVWAKNITGKKDEETKKEKREKKRNEGILKLNYKNSNSAIENGIIFITREYA